MARIIDLSPRIPEGFMGPPSSNIGVQFDVRRKPGYWQSTVVALNAHTGCHVESALHAIEGGEAIDQVGLERVIGTAVVLDLTPADELAVVDVPEMERAAARLAEAGETIRPGDILLLRTDWSDRAIGTPRYFSRSPGLTEAAAAWLVAQQPKCVACDFFEEPAARTPGWTADQFVVHRRLLEAGIPIVEGVVQLGQLPPRVQFFAPFYKFAGIDSAPARAFAIC